jgi:hypothetical protein
MQLDVPRPSQAAVPHRAPDLATLASIAAIALDRRANGFEASLDPVVDLAAELQRSLTESPSSGGPPGIRAALLDPLTVDLLGRALSSSYDVELRSVPEVASKAREVIEQLSSSGAESAKIRALRDFCLALSRAAQAHSAAFRVTQDHPYRR